MWDQLKSIIRQTSDKAVIIEDGEPRFVVLTVQEYNRLYNAAEGRVDARNEKQAEQEQPSVDKTTPYEDRGVENNEYQDQDFEKVNEELSLEIDEQARQQAEKMLRPELNTEQNNENLLI